MTDAPPRNRFADPAARNYLFVGLAALLVAGAVLFLRNGAPALVPALIAVAGLLLRGQTLLPGIFMVAAALASVPLRVLYGSPFSDVPDSHFRVLDIVFVGAVVAYFACQYRLLALTHQAMPFDAPVGTRRRSDKPTRRPGSIVPADEIGRMFAVVGLAVLLGQLAWLAITEVRVDFRRPVPLTLDDYSVPAAQRAARRSDDLWATRFLLSAGLAAVVLTPAGLALWYWRLARLTPAEARMTLLDVGWREGRREYNRQEKWRAWGLTRWGPKRVVAPRPAAPAPPPRKPGRRRRSFFEACAVTALVLVVGVVVAVVAVGVITYYIRR